MSYTQWQSEDGRITLYNGDCMAVMPELDGYDAIITDPPYGISYQSAWRTDKNERFDILDNDGEPQTEWIKLAKTNRLVVFHEWRYADTFRKAMEESGMKVRSQIVWDRRVHGMGDLKRQFAPQHDLAWFACGDDFAFPGTRPTSVLSYARINPEQLEHPTQKPVPLMTDITHSITKASETVLDPFMGSGSTIVACVKTGRNAIGIELNTEYFNTAVKRVKQELSQGTLFDFDFNT